jgi:hypothetical protein
VKSADNTPFFAIKAIITLVTRDVRRQEKVEAERTRTPKTEGSYPQITQISQIKCQVIET